MLVVVMFLTFSTNSGYKIGNGHEYGYGNLVHFKLLGSKIDKFCMFSKSLKTNTGFGPKLLGPDELVSYTLAPLLMSTLMVIYRFV